MTLRELKNKVGKTEGVVLPTAKELCESAIPVLIIEKTPMGEIAAYENGFAIYKSGNASTVLRIDKCKDYTYVFDDETTSYCGEDVFIDGDWSILLVLIGEDRIAHNTKERDVRNGVLQLDGELISDVPDVSQDFVAALENAEICRYAMSCLTELQKQAITLFFFEGRSMVEIADFLGVRKQTISRRIQDSIEKMKIFMSQW